MDTILCPITIVQFYSYTRYIFDALERKTSLEVVVQMLTRQLIRVVPNSLTEHGPDY